MSHQHRQLVPADAITDTMIRECRMVRVGTTEGRLIGTYATGGQIVLTLLVGDPAVRAFVPVDVGEAVEVWRATVA